MPDVSTYRLSVGMKNTPQTLEKRNAKRRHWMATIDPNSFPHTTKRVCKECKTEANCRWTYSYTQTGKPEYRTRCDLCFNQRERTAKAAKRKLGELKSSINRQHLRVKQKCIAFLGGRCAECGYAKSVRALTFHHITPSEKSQTIASMIRIKSWDAITRELKKCVLLCFNCHMELEEALDHGAVRLPLPDYQRLVF